MKSYAELYPTWAPIIDGFFVLPTWQRFHGRISYGVWKEGIPFPFEEVMLILLMGE